MGYNHDGGGVPHMVWVTAGPDLYCRVSSLREFGKNTKNIRENSGNL